MHAHRADKPLGIRKGLTNMIKDPLYEVSDHDRAWLIALAVAIAAGIFVAIGTELSRLEAEAPAESPPPPAAPEIRTEVPTGRMICEKTGEHGCAEWRIYRTVEH